MPEGVQHLSISLSVDQVEFPEAEMELELFEDGKSIKRTRGLFQTWLALIYLVTHSYSCSCFPDAIEVCLRHQHGRCEIYAIALVTQTRLVQVDSPAHTVAQGINA